MVLQFVVLPLRCSGGTYHCPPDPAYVYCPFIYHVICRIRSTPTVGGTLLAFSLQINFDREFFRVLCSRTVVRRDHSNKRLKSPIVWRRLISLMQKMGMTFGGMPLSRTKVDQTGRELLSCAYTTQLLHSTVEVCWNNSDSIFIWLNLCAESRDK